MTARKAYTAVYRLEDDSWIVEVKGLKGCQTHGRSFQQAQARIREALSVWLDTPANSLAITDRVPAELAELALRVATARSDAERAGQRAQRTTLAAVHRLAKLGLSRRDTAALLGLSHQRVQQLLEAG